MKKILHNPSFSLPEWDSGMIINSSHSWAQQNSLIGPLVLLLSVACAPTDRILIKLGAHTAYHWLNLLLWNSLLGTWCLLDLTLTSFVLLCCYFWSCFGSMVMQHVVMTKWFMSLCSVHGIWGVFDEYLLLSQAFFFGRTCVNKCPSCLKGRTSSCFFWRPSNSGNTLEQDL